MKIADDYKYLFANYLYHALVLGKLRDVRYFRTTFCCHKVTSYVDQSPSNITK